MGALAAVILASCASAPSAAHRDGQAGREVASPASTAGPLAPVETTSVPAASTTDPAPPTCLNLSPAQLVGQRFVFSFSGLVPPADLIMRIEGGEAAGVILFSSNFTSTAGLRALTAMLQAIPRPASTRYPLLIMTDQEGGEVVRVPEPSLASASQTTSAAEAHQLGADAGATLAQAGVNMDLAPVLDVALPVSFLAAQQRSYGSSAQVVARRGDAFAAGLAQEGIIATVKHFPGLGSATVSTDQAPVRVGLSLSTLRGVGEVPFASAISAGVPAVMLSTAVYPALDNRPAALSPVVATQELRGRLGFRGVSISDSLDSPALAAYGSPSQQALLATLAGTDLLAFANSYPSGAEAEDSLVGLASSGQLPASVLCGSAQRVLKLRAGLGGS